MLNADNTQNSIQQHNLKNTFSWLREGCILKSDRSSLMQVPSAFANLVKDTATPTEMYTLHVLVTVQNWRLCYVWKNTGFVPSL